jgi:hypothetical protein
MTTAEVRQAMAVIKPALQAAKPEVPEGQAPTTVPGWREATSPSAHRLKVRYDILRMRQCTAMVLFRLAGSIIV